jgi:hypothetical protein
MSQPLAELNILRTSTQGQKVAPHVEWGILLLEEVLRPLGIVGEVIDRQTVRQRRGVRHVALMALGNRRLCWALRGVIVLVVTSPAKALATIFKIKLAVVARDSSD